MIQTNYDIALSQIGDYDTDAIKKAFYEMAWIESGNIVDRKQGDKEDGLARGKYQYEPKSAKTALNRFKNWYESTRPFKLEGAYEEANRRIAEEDYDFSTLDEDYQDVFNLINHQQNPKTSMADLSSGKISSMDFWINYHATLKGTTRDKRIEEWQSRIGDIPPIGSVVSPNINRGQTVDAFVSIDPRRQVQVGDSSVKLRPDGIIGMDTPYGQFTGDIGNKQLSYVGGNTSAYMNPEGYGGKYDINENTSLVAEKRKAFDGGDESFVGLQYNKKFQEGGEVEQPSLTSPVLPNQTVQPTGFVDSPQQVDTSEGFYKYNPAPNESAADFAARMPNEQPVQTLVADDSSFRPPEDYVSPRTSTSLIGSSNTTGSSSSSTTTTSTNFPKKPSNNELSSSQQTALNLLGTTEDVLASGSWDDMYDPDGLNKELLTDSVYNTVKDEYFSWLDNYEQSIDNLFDGIYGLDETYTTDFNTALDSSIKAYTDAGVKLTEKDMLHLSKAASASANIKKIMGEVEDVGLNTKFTFGADYDPFLRNNDGSLLRDGNGVAVLKNDDPFLRNADGSVMRDANGVAMINTNQALMPGGGTEIDILSSNDGSQYGTVDGNGFNQAAIDKTFEDILKPKDTESLIKTIGDTHLGKISNTSIEIRDLYDEFAATAFTYFITEDSGKALTAGATQLVKTEGVRIIADNIGDAAFKLHSPKINAMTSNAEINAYLKAETGLDYNLSGDLATNKNAANSALQGKASQNFTTYATGAATMIQTLAMGGTMEDAILAGGESIAISLGAESLGEALGFDVVTPADMTFTNPGAQAVGGAAISTIVSLARTGDVGQAAVSGATSYLMHVNPVLGFMAMGAQLIVGNPEPKNYAGYTSLNLEDMSTQSFSHGDVDGNKASPENVKYTAQGMDLVLPIIEDTKQRYGITKVLGDLEIQFGNRDGLYLTVTEDKDITGFTQRADYNEQEGDLDSMQVYQRKFNNMQELQEHVIDLFDWAAENMTVDGVLDLTGINDTWNKFQRDRAKEFVETKKDDPIYGPILQQASYSLQDGGKILDRNQKVLYNSNQAKNYGLVNKKGKAPPSARADDVPMTLKEGDFVLSQPAVNLYGKDTIERMVQRAANEAGTNLKSGGKVPVNVHNGEYIIPKKLTEYIGSNVLENMNNRGLMSVGDKTNI
jgi:hypothetical protein